MNLESKFPRYTEYNPLVPVYCATPDKGGCIHRFFDTSPISPTGRYLAVFRFPFEDRQPDPGDAGEILVIDLDTGKENVVADTRGWEPQMGANINWGGSDDELYFNDVDTSTWKPFAWKLNPKNGKRMKMDGTVYHASPDGRWLISANMTTMSKTQPGYGVKIPRDVARMNIGPASDDGFYLTDTRTGRSHLLLTLKDAFEKANPRIQVGDEIKNSEVYGFHSKFNPQGDRLMLSIRWFPAKDKPRWDMFKEAAKEVRFAWVTMKLDGSELHCAVGPEEWDKGGHHGTWFPDGKRISMNLNIDRDDLRFVQVNYDGSGLRKIFDNVLGSGHPTVHPDGKHLLTDTYTKEKASFNDGTIPLRWLELATGKEKVLVRINTKQPSPDGVLRIDPHPAWDRTWRYVTFNAFIGDTRRVYIADMKEVIG
ncbi:MAG TPA: hypothetical protein DCZ94_03880 [Lentisphaeria bacterium]|nr:MAG: hypothetical protein A2X48_05100 [Lentisphaerae bacterium GWF2_49_21]HBC86074.1 hypothetical protein [Lentisphaeria bacterium]